MKLKPDTPLNPDAALKPGVLARDRLSSGTSPGCEGKTCDVVVGHSGLFNFNKFKFQGIAAFDIVIF